MLLAITLSNMLKKLLIAFLVFASNYCIFAASSFAHSTVSQGYLLTHQPTFSLGELESQTFTPFEGILSLGYGNEYLWLKIHVPSNAEYGDPSKNENLILKIRPTYLGEIELFDPPKSNNPNAILQPDGLTGQRYAMNSNGYDSINHGFKIFSADQSRDIYLRVKTTTTRMISVDLLPESKAYEEDRRQLVITSGFLFILIFFVFWAALQWLIFRERLLALFTIKQIIVLAFGITNLGFMKMLFGEDAHWVWIDSFVKVNNFTYVGAYYLFEITFLSYFLSSKRYFYYACSGLVVWALGLMFFIGGMESLGLRVNMYLTLTSPVIFLFLVSKTKSNSKLPGEQPPLLSKGVLYSFYVFYILAIYWVVLPNIGIINAKDFALTLAVYVSVISSILMATMLMLRSYNISRQKTAIEAEALIMHQKLLQEKSQREQQSKFIAMLTHELKTPISVAKLSLDAMGKKGVEGDRIQRALQNMNDVVERCRMSDALEGRRFEVRNESFDLREAIFECIDMLETPQRVKVFEGNNTFINSDLQLVSIVVANLLDNALKYSPDLSEVKVFISQQVREGVLGVSLLVSNLAGAAGKPDADRVFQKYYRAKKAEGKSGSGLGLYLTEGIADLLGGKVTYRSAESRIEFELWLPN